MSPSPSATHKTHAVASDRPSLTQATANILPCHIQHDGPIPAAPRYWSPTPDTDGHSTAYLRGRRLRGRAVPLPQGYTGALLQGTRRATADTSLKDAAVAELEARRGELDAETYADEEDALREALARGELAGGEVCLVEQVADVAGVVVWEHDRVPEAEGDAFVRGVTEWAAVAEAVHAV